MKKVNLKLRLILIVICAISSVTTIFAQNTSNLSKLQAKEWRMLQLSERSPDYELKVTKDEFISICIYEGKRYQIKEPFYLSNEIPEMFDEQKVGGTGDEKYIIRNTGKRNPDGDGFHKEIRIYEILELTKTDLRLKSIFKKGTIIIGDGLSSFKNK